MTIRQLAGALLVASLMGGQAASQERVSGLLGDPRLLGGDEIAEQFAAGGQWVDVIVGLHPTEELDSFAAWDDGGRAALHRDRVAGVVRSVVDTLPASEFAEKLALENVPVFAGSLGQAGLARLLADPRVATVEPDRMVEAATDQGISLMSGNVVRGAFDGSRLSIAIVDTGIDYSHPAFGSTLTFPNSKVIGGWDFGDNDADPRDFNGHGSGAGGVAAGLDTSSGDYVGGVAPGAKLYALKIISGGSGGAPDSTILAAWDWCVTHKNDDPAHPILVMNTSFGGGMHTAPVGGIYGIVAANVKAAGIMNFASAGNEGYCAALATPAAVTDVISVGAVYDADIGSTAFCRIEPESCVATVEPSCTNTGYRCDDPTTQADQVTCYSNSATFLDLLAPSNAAHAPDAAFGYQDFGGTSAASPYAAGAAALLLDAALAIGTPMTPDEVLAVMTSTGTPIFDPKSSITKPRVDLGGAISTYGKWVDFDHVGVEFGFPTTPFNTVQEAAAASPIGGQVLIKAGMDDPTPLTISKNLRLRSWGGTATIGS